MKMNIRNKLVLAFAAIVALTAITGYIGYDSANRIDTMLGTLYNNQLEAISHLKDAIIHLSSVQVAMRSSMLTDDTQLTQQQVRLVQVNQTKFEEDMAAYEKLIITDSARRTYQQVMKDYAKYKAITREILTLAVQNKNDQAAQLMWDEANPKANLLVAAMNDLVTIKEEEAENYYLGSDKVAIQSRNLILGFTIFSILIGAVVAFVLSRSISQAARQMALVAESISKGELEHSITVNTSDEMGVMASSFSCMIGYLQNMAGMAQKMAMGDLTQNVTPVSEKDVLGNAFKDMVDHLRTLVSEVMDHASSLGAASQQLASAANQAGQATSQISSTIQQIAQGTAQQSESVTRTATSVEQVSRAINGVARGAQNQTQAVTKAAEITGQIAVAIQQVSANAQAGADSSGKAAEVAQGGAQTVKATLKGMETIQAKVDLSAQKVQEMGARSEQIGVIVETIEDIASQTNLLALNAAIEAARAGEHGKGFAVVADEVRKLAERASAATKEIGALVTDIQRTVNEAVSAMKDGSSEVERGVQQASQAGQALEQILGSARDVNGQVTQIASAAEQMSSLSNELVAATDAVSAVVEENTAATEEISASSMEVAKAIENIASVSEENGAAVEEVTTSAEEMSAQVEEVTASAQSLAAMAQALQQVVAQFKLAHEQPTQNEKTPTVQPILNDVVFTSSYQKSNGRSPMKVL